MHSHGDKKNKGGGDGALTMVLVGNPNVGKSVIFGILTGRYATVSNYPGTTVEVSKGSAVIKGKSYDIIDSPGVNSLLPMSEDERVTRDILLNRDVDTVVQVFDSKNLRRGLLITFQLIEMGLPFSLSLNMYDEAGERGISIDAKILSEITGLNVVKTIATQRWGIDELKGSISKDRKGSLEVSYPALIEAGISDIEALLPEANISGRALALMLLGGDDSLDPWLKENVSTENTFTIKSICDTVQSRFTDSVAYIINIKRLREVDHVVGKVLTKETKGGNPIAKRIGRWAMDPLLGIPILFFVLFVMYEFVGVLGAGVFVDFLETFVFGSYLNPWSERVVSIFFPTGFVHDLLVGPYGLITMALTYAIAIILPIVGAFFIFFGILEDSGYLPRLAVMVDRIFKMMGLNGKAVLPMVLGLGCDTMATMTTRILETRKERVIVTLLLALGVPCSAQLGVILGMLGSVSFTATIVWIGVVLLVMFIVGYLSSKIVPGERSDFILEIPPMRVPQASNILLKTLVRAQWYLKEAVPLFIIGTLMLFALDKLDLLTGLQNALSPIIKDFLGLPVEATEAFIVGFLRRDYGAAGLLSLQRKGMLDPVQVVVSLVTITLFVPCIANLLMIVKEMGLKVAIMMTIFIFPFAILVGGILNFILRGLNITF
jgi:ferrous iron transport protein B